MNDIANLMRDAATYIEDLGREADYHENGTPFVIAKSLRAAAESLGDPVAWLCTTDGACDAVVTDHARETYARCGRTIHPLYLAPHPAGDSHHE